MKPSPPQLTHASPDDLLEMIRALEFAADLLRDELGPGGIMCRESDELRAAWQLSIDCLESAATVPMIPLYLWRRRKEREASALRPVKVVTLTAAHPPDRPGGHVMSISKIKIVAVAVVVMAIVALCAAMVTGAAGFPEPGVTQQDDVEDCDAEDWANREDDCGFTKPSPRKTTAVKVTPKATAGPRVTRR